MITVYSISFNEQTMLPFFIKHYRSRFPNCNIVIYDNYSDDDTEKIALENDCKIIKYDTGGKLSDAEYLNIKNNAWKKSETDWVLVCDMDEFLDINLSSLLLEEKRGTTIIKPEGFDMINSIPYVMDIDNMNTGVRNEKYDKCVLFNKKHISEINYRAGCHKCKPVGNSIYNKNTYKLYHNRYVEENYLIKRYKINKSRLSDDNIKKNQGIHYLLENEDIINKFLEIRQIATKVDRFNMQNDLYSADSMKDYICFGDSHARNFLKFVKTYTFPASSARGLNNQNSLSNTCAKIREIVTINRLCKFIFFFGKVDIEFICNYKYNVDQNINFRDYLNQTVGNYILFIKSLKLDQIYICELPISHLSDENLLKAINLNKRDKQTFGKINEKYTYQKEYKKVIPFVERNNLLFYFNNILKQECKNNNFKFLEINKFFLNDNANTYKIPKKHLPKEEMDHHLEGLFELYGRELQ